MIEKFLKRQQVDRITRFFIGTMQHNKFISLFRKDSDCSSRVITHAVISSQIDTFNERPLIRFPVGAVR